MESDDDDLANFNPSHFPEGTTDIAYSEVVSEEEKKYTLPTQCFFLSHRDCL